MLHLGKLCAALLAAGGAALCMAWPEQVGPFWPLLILAGSLAAGLAQRSLELGLEYSILLITLPVLHACGAADPRALGLAPFLALVIAVAHPWRLAPALVLSLAVAAGTAYVLVPSAGPGHVADKLAVLLGLAAATLYALSALARPGRTPDPRGLKLDLLLCSYSGNTAHLADAFIAGARAAGSEVCIHRFHHGARFAARLVGDALAIAFPVIAWKPPWQFFWYLVRRLPRGQGRPAFLLFTCAGGPENTAVLMWLVLTFKGYRVAGHLWAMYPLNLMRPGPRRLWLWLDRVITPGAGRLRAARKAGAAFARGEPAGPPLIFWPAPLFLVGLLSDNRYLDWLLAHHHVSRQRCQACELCVRYCPVSRLTLVDGLPRSQAVTCTFCFGCVNICPHHALHLWLLTELGQPYRQFVQRMQVADPPGQGP